MKYELSAEEYDRIKAIARLEEQELDEEGQLRKPPSVGGDEDSDDEGEGEDDLPPEYDMANYDNDGDGAGHKGEEMDEFAVSSVMCCHVPHRHDIQSLRIPPPPPPV